MPRDSDFFSVNFQRYADWQRQGRWVEATKGMAEALERMCLAGAAFGLIARNTMDIVFDEVQAAVPMPLLSNVDATAKAIRDRGLRSVGLLGTDIVLGCTEIPLPVRPEDCELPLFNTTVLHAERALALAVRAQAPPPPQRT